MISVNPATAYNAHCHAFTLFLARDGFVRTNRRAIAMMSSVCLSAFVRLSGTGACIGDHALHFRADLSLWLDSPMFWSPGHQRICKCI